MVQETGVQSQVTSYQRLKKWYLIPPCLTLSNIWYVSRVKWSNLGKGVAPSPTQRCSSYWKRSLLVALNYSHQLFLLLLEYLDNWPYLYCYNHNVLANMSFRCFMSNLVVHTKSRTEPFIWSTGIDCSNSVNHDHVQGISYCKYSLFVLPVVGIEPATSTWL